GGNREHERWYRARRSRNGQARGMTYEEVIFYVIAVPTVLGAIGVVTARNVVHSALFLIPSLLSVAGIFILLSAEFLAIVQVLIYGGAVTILVLFAMMLTRVRDL